MLRLHQALRELRKGQEFAGSPQIMVWLLLQQMDRQTNLCCCCLPGRGDAGSLWMLFSAFQTYLNCGWLLIYRVLSAQRLQGRAGSSSPGTTGLERDRRDRPQPLVLPCIPPCPALNEELRKLFIHGPGSSAPGFYPELKGAHLGRPNSAGNKNRGISILIFK